MHELSLANSVMNIVEREMERHPARCLKDVEITVGSHAGVETEAFSSAVSAVLRASDWPEAVARIVIIPAEAECIACGARFIPTGYIPVCPECGSSMCGIVAGDEFRVSAITIE